MPNLVYIYISYLKAYKTHGCIRRTSISAGQIKKKSVTSKMISKWYSLGNIYEM